MLVFKRPPVILPKSVVTAPHPGNDLVYRFREICSGISSSDSVLKSSRETHHFSKRPPIPISKAEGSKARSLTTFWGALQLFLAFSNLVQRFPVFE